MEYPAVRRKVASVPAGRPIFLTGTHRSGTTWLAKMLAASGIWYVHEPFAPMKGRWPRCFDFRQSAIPDAEVDRHFSDVLAGGFRAALNLPNADHPLMPLRLLKPRFQRLLVKDPLACLLTEYLTQRFDLQTIILFRHPAGFVASICRLGWPRAEFLKQFLLDEPLMDAHLESHRPLIEKASKQDDLVAAATLCGALNLVLWRFVQQGVGKPLIFEELCSNPLDQLKALFAELGLPYDDRVRDAHHAACFGKQQEVAEYHPHAVARNSALMARSWTNQLSEDEIAQVRRIWDQFEVPLYQEEIDWTLVGVSPARKAVSPNHA